MEPTRARRALLLDLDGTLADTLPHVFESYRYAVAPWVECPPTDAEVEATFGPHERDCIATIAPGADLDAAALRSALRPERLREAGADFLCERVADLVAAIDALDALGGRCSDEV